MGDCLETLDLVRKNVIAAGQRLYVKLCMSDKIRLTGSALIWVSLYPSFTSITECRPDSSAHEGTALNMVIGNTILGLDNESKGTRALDTYCPSRKRNSE